MSSVLLESVRKVFGTTVAVDEVNLEIATGDLFFLLGPSGCGKTTLLRMIAGFATPSGGRITIGDRDVTKLPAEKRDTGMVFQSYALWPHMSVRENVAFGLKVRKLERSRVDSEVDRALELVRMTDYAARKPNELSGGQQQRVALARALAFKPSILLLDEPLSNLDAKLRIEMRSEIRRIVDELGVTTIYVTHDQKEALSLADDMVVMRDGLVVQRGSPRELYTRPSSRFTADFLGETNLISAEIRGREDDRAVLSTVAGDVHSTAIVDTLPDKGNITLSIRPEALAIIHEGESVPEDSSVINGTLIDSIFLGEMAQHRVDIGGDVVLKVFQLNPRQLAPGSDIRLAIDPEDVVLLRD
ncbi:MAG: ABC transporter ATP-binding protein [Phycisphaerales bacterium]|jgi:iron(III) transport system ATP-binding protein|nr:ABC transporter ATP-binding protein [Phycisphaerales bacterium]